MSEDNNEQETKKKTLREKVQSFRAKARTILRMDMINKLLQRVFQVNKELASTAKFIEALTKDETSAEKIVARTEYKMSNLNEDDPDFEEKKEKAIALIDMEKLRQEKLLKCISSEITLNNTKGLDYTKQIATLNEEIEKVESGETKISIDEINDLAQRLITKS